jgi:hypothetical protein
MNFNPVEAIEAKVSEVEAKLFLSIRLAILREDANVVLSRLAALDPDRPERYSSALESIK